MGVSPAEAAERATKQIAVAVVGTTAALVFAFLPLMMLPGGAGQFIRPLPLAVVFTVTASLFVALALIPLFASWMLTGREDTEGSRALRLVQGAIHAVYRPVLHFCMRRRVLTLGVAGLLLVGSVALLPSIGFSLFPRAGTPQFSIRIEADEGTGISGTDARVRAVEAVLAETPEIEWWFANVGRGNPQIYYNEIPSESRSSVGEIFVQWSVATEKEYARRAEALRQRLSSVAGARIVVKEFENGPPITAPIVVKLLGEDLESLVGAATQVDAVLSRLEGTRDVENPVRVPRTDLRVRIDRARAGLAGVQEQEIDRAARLAIAGVEATRFREADGDEYGVLVGVGRGEFADLSNWDRALVTSPSGPIPLNQVATLEFLRSPALIQRDKRERSINVNAFVREGFNTAKVTAELERQLGAETFPSGIRWRFGGEVESREESFSGIGSAIVIATFGILAVLVLEFKSFRGTLIVASVVPLGIVGGLVALWLTGNSLSFTAAIGFVALMGIEIKNSILLVDFTNQLRDEGVPLETAIEQAGETRFLPVVLTTATAIGALLPLAVEGSGLYSPLAIVLIGGLCSSLVLSRVVTPVLYSLLPPERGSLPQAATEPLPG
jgi:multidrug efflux pump subunit AcrB